MKKYIKIIAFLATLLTLFSLLAGCNATLAKEEAIAIKRIGYTYQDLLADYKNPSGRPLVIAHRADLSNYPENSLAAIRSCIDMGVDMVELDLRKSADGVWVLSHDATLMRTTDGWGFVSRSTLAELKELNLKEGRGWFASTTEHQIATFAEALELCKGKIMINMDKLSYKDKDEIYDLLLAHDAVECAIFKFSATARQIREWFDTLEAQGKPLPLYSPKVGWFSYESASRELVTFAGLAYMAEIGYRGSPKKAKQLNELCIQNGMRPMRTTLLATNDYKGAWQRGLELKFNVLMTNKPSDMLIFLSQ